MDDDDLIDVDAMLTEWLAEVDAERAAKLASDPDFQRGEAEGEAWQQARQAAEAAAASLEGRP